ncbi:MAG: aminotransferase class V-fold PLP-dependent enzyme [Oscillospiraceae bacterium]
MNKFYFDNASTTFPKAPTVSKSVANYIDYIGCNVGRGSYQTAYSASAIVLETRELLADLFNFPTSSNVVFTQSITYALNFILKGFLQSGDHVIVSGLEHNAVMRPLVQLEKKGVSFSRVASDIQGKIQAKSIIPLIQKNTKAVIFTTASNVCGTIMPIAEIGAICKEYGIRFIVDSAQTAGVFPINMRTSYIDALCFTGHKGLLATQGIGGFLITTAFADLITPLISGGTGSASDSEEMPSFLPDKFESGTMNIPAIFGLNASLKYIMKYTVDAIREKELYLTHLFIQGIKKIDGIKIIGCQDTIGRTSVVSLDFYNLDNAEVSYHLDITYSIMTRCGMHCAPSAHKSLNTFPQGTVRFSFGHFNTEEEILCAVKYIEMYLNNRNV